MTRSRLLAVTALAVLLCGRAHGTTLRVDDNRVECPGAPYQSIADAIDDASEGDTIEICSGTYVGQLVIAKRLALRGLAIGGTRPIVQPRDLPVTQPSLLAGSAIAAGVLVNATRVIIEDLDIDLTQNTLDSCQPTLAGVYFRNSQGAMIHSVVRGARVLGHPTCNSGVGLYIEGDGNAPFPVGRIRVILRDNLLTDYQRGGVVASGPGVIAKDKGSEAVGSGLTPDGVQIGFQFSREAFGTMKSIRSRGHATSVPGKIASGVLIENAPRVTLRRSAISDGQTGVFVSGETIRLRSNTIANMSGDGIVLLGSHNLAISNNLLHAGPLTCPPPPLICPAGVFVDGERNVVRGGTIADAAVGVWLYGDTGPDNLVNAVTFSNIVTDVQGAAGGARTVTLDMADPFLPRCSTDEDCNDGTPCSAFTCNVTTGTCAQQPNCNDFNACTADSCDSFGGCLHVLTCDDGNPCSVDTCNPLAGCNHAGLPDGTPCGVGLTCAGGICQ